LNNFNGESSSDCAEYQFGTPDIQIVVFLPALNDTFHPETRPALVWHYAEGHRGNFPLILNFQIAQFICF